ncbi:MAG: PHP domain-containing protein [Planctomycetes bacterium]|nr:PHP domain-containing protein [Planctomycetota bacterium]
MKIDLHCHSKFSFDSKMEVEKVLETAVAKGLDALAITDHDTIEGALFAQKIQKDYRIQIVIGEEIHTDLGDVIGLFLTSEIKIKKWEKVLEEIRRQEGVILFPHPLGAMGFHHDTFLKKIDFIEAFNPRYSVVTEVIDGKGDKAVHHCAEVYNLKVASDSDSHNYDTIGLAYTEIPGQVEDIKRALLNSDLKIFGKKPK